MRNKKGQTLKDSRRPLLRQGRKNVENPNNKYNSPISILYSRGAKGIAKYIVVVVRSFSHVLLFVSPQTAARLASLSFTISGNPLKLMCVESVMPSNHLILCPLLLLPSIFSSIRVFSNELALHIRWPKYWSFSFSITLSNEYSDQFPLGLTALISLLSKGLSRVFSNTTVQKNQFFGIRPSFWSNSHIHT